MNLVQLFDDNDEVFGVTYFNEWQLRGIKDKAEI
jgi:hypothetical protein